MMLISSYVPHYYKNPTASDEEQNCKGDSGVVYKQAAKKM